MHPRLEPLPDELTIRRTIAERMREIRALRSVERALAKYRQESTEAQERRDASAQIRHAEVTCG